MNLRQVKENVGQWPEGLFNLFFPNVCTVCRKTLVRGERILCLDCRMSLPLTNFHRSQPNQIHERLFAIGHPIERATSMFYYYRGNRFVNLIHDTKYRGRPIVGKTLAADHASQLLAVGFFDGIEAIVPVPLHFLKRLRRGYNQAEEIACGISDVTGLPILDVLSASFHRTQTRKNAHERIVNTRNVYHLAEPTEIEGKHILLVDDVITTGATLLSCIEEIKRLSPTTRVSVYSLAITRLD